MKNGLEYVGRIQINAGVTNVKIFGGELDGQRTLQSGGQNGVNFWIPLMCISKASTCTGFAARRRKARLAAMASRFAAY